jgi:hypothetical protein
VIRFLAAPGDYDRLAAQLRIVPLLGRGAKGLHVDMHDLRTAIWTQFTFVIGAHAVETFPHPDSLHR